MYSFIKNRIYESLQEENRNPVVEAFHQLSSGTAVDSIKFMSDYRRLPTQQMIDNMHLLIEMGTKTSISFFNLLLETNNFSDKELNNYKGLVQQVIDESSNPDDKLLESKQLIDKLLIKYNSNEYLKENALMHLYTNRIKQQYVVESYIDNELEIIMYNINYSPETITDLETLLRKIRTSKTTQHFGSFPKLLERSTDMIKILDKDFKGDVLNLVTSIPEVVVDKLISSKVPVSQMKTYKKIYLEQAAIMSKTLKGEGRPELYNLYTTYLRVIIKSLEKIDKYCGKAVTESVAEMQPDIIVSADDTVIDELAAEIEEAMISMIFDDADNIDDEVYENFTRLTMTYERLTEGKVVQKMNKAAGKVGDATRKVSNKVIATSHDVKQVKTNVSKSVEPLANLFNKTINDIKESDKKARTEKIITGQYRFKLTGMVKRAIGALAGRAAGKAAVTVGANVATKVIANKVVSATGAKVLTGAVAGAAKLAGPVMAIIGFRVAIAIDKKIDEKYRKQILNDLELELKMVKEKIEDAKSDGDKEAKYELMRIENKLEKDIDRIKFGLKP